jgi:hypothetical protein
MTRVVIGMDPHKRSVTIEVMAPDESVLDGGRYGTDQPGYAAMLRHARQWPERHQRRRSRRSAGAGAQNGAPPLYVRPVLAYRPAHRACSPWGAPPSCSSPPGLVVTTARATVAFQLTQDASATGGGRPPAVDARSVSGPLPTCRRSRTVRPMTGALVFRPGEPVAIVGTYGCDCPANAEHRFVARNEPGRFPRLPDGCLGQGWVWQIKGRSAAAPTTAAPRR